jgi:hypothetical protein
MVQLEDAQRRRPGRDHTRYRPRTDRLRAGVANRRWRRLGAFRSGAAKTHALLGQVFSLGDARPPAISGISCAWNRTGWPPMSHELPAIAAALTARTSLCRSSTGGAPWRARIGQGASGRVGACKHGLAMISTRRVIWGFGNDCATPGCFQGLAHRREFAAATGVGHPGKEGDGGNIGTSVRFASDWLVLG